MTEPKRTRDKDILALRGSVRALNKSSSRRMLRANLEFLIDRYLVHLSSDLPRHLK